MNWLVLLLPCIGILILVIKIPFKAKLAFFKIPIWLSSTILAVFLGSFMTGVMAVPSIILMDIVLWPCFWVIKTCTFIKARRLALE